MAAFHSAPLAAFDCPLTIIALAVALIELAIAAARKFTDPDETGLSLALVNTATTGHGKNHAFKCITEALVSAGMEDRIGGGWASPESIQDRFKENPVRAFLVDEFGIILKLASNPRDIHKYAVPALFNTLLTADYYLIRDKAGEGNKGIRIAAPNAFLYGAATHGTYWNSMSDENAENGFGGRVVNFACPPRTRRNMNRRAFYTPDEVIDYLRYLHGLFPENNCEPTIADFDESKCEREQRERERLDQLGVPPTLWRFPRAKEAMPVYDGFRDRIDDRYSHAEEQGDNTACAIYSRASEQCNKFALLHTINNLFDAYKDDPECYENAAITREAVEWAIALTEHIIAQKLYHARHRRPDTEFTRNRGKVITALRGGRLSRSLLIKNSHLSAEILFGYEVRGRKHLGGVVGTMVQSGEVREIADKTAKNGKTPTYYELNGKVEL